MSQLAELAGSIVAILFLAWLAGRLKLGGDVRISDEAHARILADEAHCGFDPVDVVVDKAGLAALLKDADGRHMLIRQHGARFVARLLDSHSESRLDQNLLTIGTGESKFGRITLNLGSDAQHWASGLRHLKV